MLGKLQLLDQVVELNNLHRLYIEGLPGTRLIHHKTRNLLLVRSYHRQQHLAIPHRDGCILVNYSLLLPFAKERVDSL
ncbi:hypothetical protein SDC9_97027 [bioreactor metagenome]|uniref:Uncharacterized protein n=1 Tax=bioreactor metagenome TaxID=1076179 RepID=A0A645AC60_9ZZZZ